MDTDSGTGLSSQLEDLSQKDVQIQEQDQIQEKPFVGLEEDLLKKEADMGEAQQQADVGKIDRETKASLIQQEESTEKVLEMGEEESTEKELEMGEGKQKVKDGAEIELETEKKRKGKDVLMESAGDKEDLKEGLNLSSKGTDAELGGDAKQEDKQKKKEEGKKEKGEDGKKEKKEEPTKEKKEKSEKKDTSGQPEDEKKKEKKEKKEKRSKHGSERIRKKLEKIDAKIVRILAKKEEYEVRLKEVLEKERQEAEKVALPEKEETTAVSDSPATDTNTFELRREESVLEVDIHRHLDIVRKNSSGKVPEKQLSGSISRTASLIEVAPADILEALAGQKKVVEKLEKLLVLEEKKPRPPVEEPDPANKETDELGNHTVRVEVSHDFETYQ